MPEKLSEMLKKLAGGLHWLGKYGECNTLIYLSRWVRRRELETLDDLKAWMESEETGPTEPRSREALSKIQTITESNYDDADAKKLLLEIKEVVVQAAEAGKGRG